MRVRPVLDLLNGVVVRGIGGHRGQYRPIVSRLTTDPSPLAVARSLADTFGFRDFYVADLDAILHARPNLTHLEELTEAGFRLAVDAGVKSPEDVDRLLSVGVDTVILGLESLRSPEMIGQIANTARTPRFLFSLDLQHGKPLATEHWPATAPAILDLVLAAGLNRLLVLDLADVGTAAGGSTHDLIRGCRVLPQVQELWSGGGVRGPGDLRRWEALEIDEVLVASALHDGRLTAADVDGCTG